MLWFVAERWDLSLALIARRCGIPPACMAYMPISTLVHDGKGAGPTFDLYTKIAKEHELDERLVEGVNRLLDQELKKYGLEELRRSAQCMQETQDCYIVYCTVRHIDDLDLEIVGIGLNEALERGRDCIVLESVCLIHVAFLFLAE